MAKKPAKPPVSRRKVLARLQRAQEQQVNATAGELTTSWQT